MEASQIYDITKESILKDIDAFYQEECICKLRYSKYGIGDGKDSIVKYMVLKAFENMIKRDFECHGIITNDMMQKIKLIKLRDGL